MKTSFNIKIKKLRLEKNITLINAAKQLGINSKTLASWESGKTKPNAKGLIALSKYYMVRCDYLLGLSDFIN